MQPVRALARLAILAACASALPAGAAPSLMDRDGDGLPDAAYVLDWDDDGVLEMVDDVQAAVDALTDPGPRLVRVGPGVFLPPPNPPRGHGLLQLPDRTTLACAGPTQTTLRGVSIQDTSYDQPVVTNLDHVLGNRSVTVRDCGIDGGMPDDYAVTLAQGPRMGIYFAGVVSGVVQGNHVHHTHHACVYAKNSTQLTIRDNLLEDCGNHPAHVGSTKPAIYIFADGTSITGATVGVWISGNVMRRVGAAGIATRRDSASQLVQSVWIDANQVEDAGTACLQLRGVQGVVATDTTCTDTGPGLYTSDVPATLAHDGVKAASDIVVDGLQVLQPKRVGIDLYDRLERVELRNVRVESTGRNFDCLRLRAPVRDLVVEGATLVDCGGAGVHVLQTSTVYDPDGGSLALRSIRVEGADTVDRNDGIVHDGVRLDGSLVSLEVADVTVTDVTGDGLRATGMLESTSVAGLQVLGGAANGTGRAGLRFEGRATGVSVSAVVGSRLPAGAAVAVEGGASRLTVKDVVAWDDGAHGLPRERSALSVGPSGMTGSATQLRCVGTDPAFPCLDGSISAPGHCGLGAEIGPVLAAVGWLSRRRRRRSRVTPTPGGDTPP